MKCQHIDEKANFDLVEQGIFPKSCPTPATRRHGHRLYCEAHAPKDSVKLDPFVTDSKMTVGDKAVEYDRIAEYLRKQGWSVMAEWRGPEGCVRQSWQREDHDKNSFHDWMSAYRMECFEDAPKQGERSAKMFKGLSDAIDKKNRARRAYCWCGHTMNEHRWVLDDGTSKCKVCKCTAYRAVGCTCDAVGEGPCPLHGEAMRVQDERLRRMCPSCGSSNINETETVCLACSNKERL